MFKAFEFCIPTKSTTVPHGPEWLHEIKHDGFRIRVERDRVRLITRGGYDWTSRFPWIGEAALKNRIRQFVSDGEAVILGVDGISDFNALHSGRHNDEVQPCAFDVLAMDGDDLRRVCCGRDAYFTGRVRADTTIGGALRPARIEDFEWSAMGEMDGGRAQAR